MHTVHIPTWYHSIGERVMPSQLPALASRRLEITELHVRLQQQIRRGSFSKVLISPLFAVFNRSRFVKSSSKVLVNPMFIAFNCSSQSKSLESTSIALVDPPIPARVPPPPIESFAYRETGISSKRSNSNVIEIDDNSSR
nr:protein CHROMATIN REMODELING 19 [Ipomoea batatas]